MLLTMQHILYRLHVGLVNDGRVAEVAFALGALLGQNMAVIGMVPLDFSGAGKRESFLGTCLGL